MQQEKVENHFTTTSSLDTTYVTYNYSPDVTDFINEVRFLPLNEPLQVSDLSQNPLMLKIIAEGLMSTPDPYIANSYSITKNEKAAQTDESISISIPWSFPDGKTITLTIPDIEKKTLQATTDYLTNLSVRASNTNIEELLLESKMANSVNKLDKLKLKIQKKFITKNKSALKKDPSPSSNPDSLTTEDIRTATVKVSYKNSIFKEQKNKSLLTERDSYPAITVNIGKMEEKLGVYILSNGKPEIGMRKFLPMYLSVDQSKHNYGYIVSFMKKLDEIFAKPNIIHTW